MGVDPHRASLNSWREGHRRLQAGGPQAGGQAVVGVVGFAQRFFSIRHADQIDHRAKHFFARQVQLVVRVNYQRRRNIEPLRVRPGRAADQLSVLGSGIVQIGRHFIAVVAGNQWVDLRTGIHARSDGQGFHRLLEPGHQSVVDWRFNINPRAGGAHLSLVQEAARHQAFDNLLRVGIFQHDGRVFTAQFQRHACQPVRRRAGDAFADRRGAGEAHFGNQRVFGQRFAAAGTFTRHHVEYPRWNASFGRQFSHTQQGERRGLRGFDHDGTTCGQRWHHFPHTDHQWEVPRHNAGHHANRLFTGIHLIFGPRRHRDRHVQGLAGDLGSQPGGVAHPVQRAAYLEHAGNIDRLALFQRFQLGQFFGVLFNQIGIAQ